MAKQSPSADAGAPVRLDVWLWAARFFKTRALAKEAIEGGKVQVAGQGAKAARSVRVGETMQVRRGEDVFELQVLGTSARRGPASVAQGLYAEDEAARETRLRLAAERRAAVAGYRPPAGKPDKRARRLIQALGDLDSL
ncbi:heat shock protein 15 [Arenimonas soli]|uniref:Heat shock protein 15 n=1 Tax=Arenimonas soli TaxID=2269504 RepID=A0ABQ1HE04_9GAMM|nr:RNA-binding S4 domain-containing protein [Arenimonas soli]GGA71385.1 heat shock protein 15 [Arenimonas soli]